MKTLKLEDVKIELITEYDDIPVRGNCIDSGDSVYDRTIEDEIIDRVNSGDVWAWASVEVKATYKGLTASDYLGACSYTSEADFKNDVYYSDMVNTVLEDLNSQVSDIVNSLAE